MSKSLVSIYCCRCRTKTSTLSPHMVVSKNGRKMIKGKCKCGTNKCQFVK